MSHLFPPHFCHRTAIKCRDVVRCYFIFHHFLSHCGFFLLFEWNEGHELIFESAYISANAHHNVIKICVRSWNNKYAKLWINVPDIPYISIYIFFFFSFFLIVSWNGWMEWVCGVVAHHFWCIACLCILYLKQVKCVLWLLDFFYFVNTNNFFGGGNRKMFWQYGIVDL